jgi:nucleoside-diphosphate-sugar epimerase
MLAVSATRVVAPRAGVGRLGKSRRASSRRVVSSRAKTRGSDRASPLGRVLVLGGTGFVGSRICVELLDAGYDVTSVSRRGTPPLSDDGDAPSASANNAARLRESVDWRVGDASDPETALDVLNEGGFVGVVHAVGMLLASDLNALASGSGSVPDADATYDKVTRVTAFNAADAAAQCVEGGTRVKAAPGAAARGDDAVASSPPPPFVFVSAAEARWDFRAPFDWLEEYLVAKRAVEARLATLNGEQKLRASWLRPSLVYTFEKPAALPAVFAFVLGNALGIPFVDRPVTVDTLARAAVRALSDGKTSGCLDYREMERLANEPR